MARTRRGTPPSYPKSPHHGQARITVPLTTGKRHDLYLGIHGSHESRAEHSRVLATLNAHNGFFPVESSKPDVGGITLNEVALRFWGFAENHYRRLDGSPSGELEHFRYSLTPLLDLFGDTLANEFGPKKLKVVRQRMMERKEYLVTLIGTDTLGKRWICEEDVRAVNEGTGRAEMQGRGEWQPVEILESRPALSRKVINQRIEHIKRFYRWAVSDEVASAEVYSALLTVPGLRQGHAKTIDYPKVGPVPEAHVNATIPFLPPQVAAMVQIQPLIGARETEMCMMRPCAILDRDKPVWKYQIDPNLVDQEVAPTSRSANLHKTARSNSGSGNAKTKTLPIGPRAQALLRPWLRKDASEFIFQPCEAREAMLAKRRERRVTPLYPSHQRHQAQKKKTSPKRAPKDHYDCRSYAKAIARAAKKAGVPHWHPHQLKHSCGTRIREAYGIEAAQAFMGHDSLSAAEIYAEKNLTWVDEIALTEG